MIERAAPSNILEELVLREHEAKPDLNFNSVRAPQTFLGGRSNTKKATWHCHWESLWRLSCKGFSADYLHLRCADQTAPYKAKRPDAD